MNAKELVVAAAATWRLSHMLLKENGPYTVFRRLREKFGVTYYPDSNDVASYEHEITVCIWCLSMWVGAGVALLYRMFGSNASWVVAPYAFSAFAASWDRLLHSVKDSR